MVVDDKYQSSFDEMISLLNKNSSDTIVFLGAGVTRKYGYATWEELIFGSKKHNGLIKVAKLSELECEKFKNYDGSYNLLGLAQKCYEKIGDKNWHTLIKQKYGNIQKVKLDIENDPVSLILKTNYFAYVTTNFDPVIKKYAEHCINSIEIQVYPKNLHQPSESNLIYLHGAGFKIIDQYEPQIVLTQDEYNTAYKKVSQITEFIQKLVTYNIVFIGFSMKDPYINEVMLQLEEYRVKTMKNNPEIDSKTFQRSKYLILPNWPHEFKGADNDCRKMNELLIDEDKTLQSQSIKIIRYTQIGEDIHKAFPDLIKEIYIKAKKKKLLPKPYDISKAWRTNEF